MDVYLMLRNIHASRYLLQWNKTPVKLRNYGKFADIEQTV